MDTGTKHSDEQVPWRELVAWAERDLRRRMQSGLSIGGRVSPTSVVNSTCRRAVVREEKVGSSLSRAKAYLSGIAKKVRREKIRNQSAQRRSPEHGQVFGLGKYSENVATPEGSDNSTWDVVASLPSDFSSLLIEVYQHGLSLAEYSRKINIEARQVSELHRRALEALKSKLGDSASG